MMITNKTIYLLNYLKYLAKKMDTNLVLLK